MQKELQKNAESAPGNAENNLTSELCVWQSHCTVTHTSSVTSQEAIWIGSIVSKTPDELKQLNSYKLSFPHLQVSGSVCRHLLSAYLSYNSKWHLLDIYSNFVFLL